MIPILSLSTIEIDSIGDESTPSGLDTLSAESKLELLGEKYVHRF